MAEDDEARWLLGEHSAHTGPPPGPRRPVTGESSDEAGDTEPTLDLSDDLALVRAIREPPQVPVEPRLAAVRDLRPDARPGRWRSVGRRVGRGAGERHHQVGAVDPRAGPPMQLRFRTRPVWAGSRRSLSTIR